jgi:arsenate reductase
MTDLDPRVLVAEFLGTALLLSAVVGSGIVTATDGAASTQLFQHAVVVGLALVVLILVFGPVSGAHFNPVVTIADWWFGGVTTGRAARYVVAQVGGAVVGVAATNAMFGEAAVAVSANPRDGLGLVAAEVVATAGLVLVIFALVRSDRIAAVPGAVGAWVGAAIFFTASACFANPAVTLSRALTDTWTGIAPASVPGFLLGQFVGVAIAIPLVRWFYAPTPAEAHDVLVPHDQYDRPTTSVTTPGDA